MDDERGEVVPSKVGRAVAVYMLGLNTSALVTEFESPAVIKVCPYTT
jgi:hypothetical protein